MNEEHIRLWPMCYPSWSVDFCGGCWYTLAVIQRLSCLLNAAILSDFVSFPSGSEIGHWHCYFGKQSICSGCLSKVIYSNGARALFSADLVPAFISVGEDTLGPLLPSWHRARSSFLTFGNCSVACPPPRALSLDCHKGAAQAQFPKTHQWGWKYSYLSLFPLAGWPRPSGCLSNYVRKAQRGMGLSPWSLI